MPRFLIHQWVSQASLQTLSALQAHHDPNIFIQTLLLLPRSLHRHLSHKRRREGLLQYRWDSFPVSCVIGSASPWVLSHRLKILLRCYFYRLVLVIKCPIGLDLLGQQAVHLELIIEPRDFFLIDLWAGIYTVTIHLRFFYLCLYGIRRGKA
jgi:hypothetical protein